MKRQIRCESDLEARLKQVYNLDDPAVALLRKAQQNLNNYIGYQAYYDLAKYIHENNLSADVLYDLAADFDWDDKLTNAVRRLAQADGFDDIPAWA